VQEPPYPKLFAGESPIANVEVAAAEVLEETLGTVGVVTSALVSELVICAEDAVVVDAPVVAVVVECPLGDPVVVALLVLASVHAQTALTDAVLLTTPSLLNQSCPLMSL
jgi:hypothetical protein